MNNMSCSSYSEAAESVGSICDVLIQILTRLPVKPLMYFQLVSKHWLSLITGPVMLSIYTCQEPKIPDPPAGLFLGINRHNQRRYEYIPLHPKHTNPVNGLPMGYDFATGPARGKIVQSCNGLLLCLNSRNCKHNYIYNPTTSSHSIITGSYKSKVGYTLAFDPLKSPHYKVISFALTNYYRKEYMIEIYSSETCTWRIVGDVIRDERVMSFRNGVYCNGSVRWILEHDTENGMRFHIATEVLQDMPHLPIVPPSQVRGNRYFGESGGRLHYIVPQSHVMYIYEMKRDYSEWFLKYQFGLSQLMNHWDHYLVLSHLGFKEDKPIVVLWVPYRAIKCNLVDGSFETLCEFWHGYKSFGGRLLVRCSDYHDGDLDPFSGIAENGFHFIPSLCHV